ncbi:MAG TPA: hypothetical protein VGJ13_16660 [Pseudonocardiaceae bacterium]
MSEEGITPGDGERDPVSVAELLARYQGKQGRLQSGTPVERVPRHPEPALLPIPSPSSTSDTGQMFVTELLRREGQDDEPSPTPPAPARAPELYRLFAVLCGLALLIGAIAASTAALSGPRAQRAVPSSAAASFAGAQALRPDLIGESVRLPPLATPSPRAGADGQDPAAPRSGATAEPQPEPGAGRNDPGRDDRQPSRAAPSPSPTPSGDVVDPQLGSTLGTVQSFFQSVATSPRQAFGLLGPQMQGPGWPEFRDAWADVERVIVDEIHPDGPDAVLVTASLERKDGKVLHTMQRVLVIPGAQPRITDARLLSASRS